MICRQCGKTVKIELYTTRANKAAAELICTNEKCGARIARLKGVEDV